MAITTTELEAPDMAARAAAAGEAYQARTEDVIGEKMVLNIGPSHPATGSIIWPHWRTTWPMPVPWKN